MICLFLLSLQYNNAYLIRGVFISEGKKTLRLFGQCEIVKEKFYFIISSILVPNSELLKSLAIYFVFSPTQYIVFLEHMDIFPTETRGIHFVGHDLGRVLLVWELIFSSYSILISFHTFSYFIVSNCSK